MKITDFKHIPFKVGINKKMIPAIELTYDQLNVFNAAYKHAKKYCQKVDPTPSSGFPNGEHKFSFRYMVVKHNQSIELVFACMSGCYRFLVQPKKLKGNTIPGRKAVLELYKMFDKYNIDFGKFRCSNGLKIKDEIESPSCVVFNPVFYCKKLSHVYHLDFNSSYASRIVEAYPELRAPYEELYKYRKENNDKYKHVLTNSVGCFQSAYCPDWEERQKVKPYAFANLSKVAINNTKRLVNEMVEKLRKKGMIPILTNVDGIWYISDKGPFHGEGEGEDLCQWKNDHFDCRFIMTSVGCYQYLENGICKTVLRGLTALDRIKTRDDWEFGDIMNITSDVVYDFDEEKGIVERYV